VLPLIDGSLYGAINNGGNSFGYLHCGRVASNDLIADFCLGGERAFDHLIANHFRILILGKTID
jgi:hypothetical protein